MINTISKNDVCIVVPIFNELESVVSGVIDGLVDAGYSNIVVVDDGSSISFCSTSSYRVDVLRHSLNRGKGAAVQTGMAFAFAHQYEAVITVDGDGQHHTKDLDALLKALNEGCDIALGTRTNLFEKMPWHKIIANKIGNAVTWIFFGLWVSDSQSGLRAYTRQAMAQMDLKSDRYEYESEVIREIARKHITFTEVPITVLYTEYSQNKKTKQSFTNGLKTIIRLFWL